MCSLFINSYPRAYEHDCLFVAHVEGREAGWGRIGGRREEGLQASDTFFVIDVLGGWSVQGG